MTESGSENLCGGEKDNGEPCGLPAGWGTDHVGSGRCRNHPDGGAPEGNQNAVGHGAPEGNQNAVGHGAPEGNQNAVGNEGGDGAPENNGNRETHGLTADAKKWFERHRDDCEDDVKEMVDSWMVLAPFGWEVTGNVRMLTNAAINECQIEYGDRYIRREGGIVQEPVSAGERIIQKDAENPAFLFKDRLQRTTLRILDKLNILDSPASRQADALEGGLDLTLSTEDKDALEAAFDTE